MNEPAKRQPLRAGQAICAAPMVEQTPAAADKPARWCLNSGAAMHTWVEGIGECVLVVDLAGVSFEAPEIPMLREHSTWSVIGRWTGLLSAIPAGITGTPIVYAPETDAEQEMPCLREAGEVAALMKRKHPWQASIKITGALSDYEHVLPGQSAAVNGRSETVDPGLGIPFVILRKGVVSEASVCLFGADSKTGAVAASRTSTNPTQESPVSDRLKALLARHGKKHAGHIAVALNEGKSDDEISASLSAAVESDHAAALAAEQAKSADLATKLAAEQAKSADLATKLAALSVPGEETNADGTPKTKVPAAGESENGAPKDLNAGMAALTAAGSKLTGFKLRSAALAKWPSLRKQIQSAVGWR